MASKKKAKTLDELLEEALVPEVEKPYELPEGWVWVNNDSVMSFVGGGTPSKSNLAYWNGDIPWATVKDVKGKYLNDTLDSITKEGLENSSANVAYPSELLLITRMSPGKTIITNIETTINQDLKIVRPKLSVLPDYMWLYFENNRIKIEHDSTGTTVKGIQIDKLKKYLFPLPPLNEQKRITSKVNLLISKIDEAQQLIEEAKETFELRRAAILENAFNFYETEELKQLKDVCTIKNGYAFKSKDFSKDGFQLIRMGNLYKNRLDLTRNPVYLPIEYDKKIIEKYMVENGDILLTLTGTKYKRDYGYAVKIGNMAENLLLNQRIMSLTPNSKDDYIFYYLQTNEFRNNFFSFETGGVNQGNVGSKAVSEIYIPWHNDEIRKEIVQSIKVQLAKEAQSLGILQIQQSIELIKQSILSKAFKGELGTNDPNDEPAIELLKSILQEKL